MAVPTPPGNAGAVVQLRSASGAAMSGADRDAMLADVRGNPASTARLTMSIRSYVQGAPGVAPNSQGVRIRDKGMAAMARSYRGAPFLRDHVEGDLSARGGTITESDLVELDGDMKGLKAIVQTVELAKPWAIEGVLDGTIDRFSTSFELVGEATCTICGDECMPGWFGLYMACDHQIGEMYANDAGAMQCCEVEFENATGRETSGVSVPAVQRTGIQSIQKALASSADPNQLLVRLASELDVEPAALARQLGLKETRMSKSFVTVLAALSLGADADEAVALAAVEKLKLERDGLAAKLSAASDRMAAAEKRLADQEQAAKTEKIAALAKAGLDDGRYLPNGTVAGHVAKLAAAGDLAGLEAYLSDMPKGIAAPIGTARQSAGTDPTPRASEGKHTAATLTAGQLKTCKQMGITPEAYAEQLNKRDGR